MSVMTKFKYAYIGIGTNLGDKCKNIEDAIDLMEQCIGPVMAGSKLYKTPPWGFNSEGDFLNGVIKINTILEPLILLKKLKVIEQKMGRDLGPKIGYQSRIIDLDILDYNGQMFFNHSLSVPHPLLTERNFVLMPLNDIDPNWKHPTTKLVVSQLIEA